MYKYLHASRPFEENRDGRGTPIRGLPLLRWSGSWLNGQLVEGHFVPVPDGRLYNRMSNNPMYIRPSAPGEFRRLCTVRRLYIVESVSFPNLVSDLL